jgi:hypothetical protein
LWVIERSVIRIQYLGAGEAAVLMARLVAAERDRRAAEAADRRAEARRLDEAEAPYVALCGWAEGIARAALYAAGYHLHKRQWRKRRPMAKKAAGEVPARAGEITALLARAQEGDEATLPQLRALIVGILPAGVKNGPPVPAWRFDSECRTVFQRHSATAGSIDSR